MPLPETKFQFGSEKPFFVDAGRSMQDSSFKTRFRGGGARRVERRANAVQLAQHKMRTLQDAAIRSKHDCFPMGFAVEKTAFLL